MTAVLTFNAGRPTFNWETVLQDVLANGSFGTNVGTATLTSGAASLTLTGDSDFTTIGDRSIAGGNITQFVLDDGSGHTMSLVYSGGLVDLADFTNIMSGVIGKDPTMTEFKDIMRPMLTPEALSLPVGNATGEGDAIYGSTTGGDTVATGAGDDYYLINADVSATAASDYDGGDGWDYVGVRLDYANGVFIDFASGEYRDNSDNHLIATVHNIEGTAGTSQNDHFIANGADDYSQSYHWQATLGDDQYEAIGHGWKFVTYAYLEHSTSDLATHADGGITVDLAAGTVIKHNAANAVVGTDHIYGENYLVEGTAHDDSFTGDPWNNDFMGLAGNDTFIGGGGNDFISYWDAPSAGDTQGISIDLVAGTGTDDYGDTDTFSGISNVGGSRFADYISGNSDSNQLLGNGDNDTLIGGDGEDTLNGGTGDDSMSGGDGDDRFIGGIAATITPGNGDQADGGVGNDWLDFYRTAPGNVGVDTVDFVLTGAGGDVTGTVMDEDSNTGAVNTRFTSIDTFVGTVGDDSFTVQSDFAGTEDGSDWRTFGDFRDPAGTVRFIGARGDDTFTDNGTTADPYGVAVIGYADESGMEGGRGSGVFVNLSTAGQSYAGYDHDRSEMGADPDSGSDGHDDTVAAGTAIDTFGYTDTIHGVTLFDLTGNNDVFFGRDNVGGDNGEFVQAGWGDDYVVGGAAADILRGDSGNDTISGGDGADGIDGGDGNDQMLGGNGADYVWGGNDDDLLFGNAGRDNLWGDNGNDTLSGGTGIDQVFGGSGEDLLHGNEDGDHVDGEDGNDTVYGDTGNDTIFGGQGLDTVLGGQGNDRVNGDDGNDVLSGDDDDFSAGNTAALQNGTNGTGADSLSGGEGNDVLYGGGGNDEVDGDAGDDTLWGGLGNDAVHGQTGSDVLHGGAGDDQMNGDDGADTLYGDAGRDNIFGGDDNGIDVLYGGDDDDVLGGGGGNDTLSGENGTDALDGGAGNDLLVGSIGNDRYYGGTGNDVYALAGFGVGDIWDEGGTDTVTTTIGRDLSAPGMGWNTIDNVTMLAGGTGDLTGNDNNNTLDGFQAASANVLAGLSGDDTYIVGAGDVVNETMGGSGGVDTVRAGISFSLADTTHVKGNVENLSLTGSGAINGTGNGLANVLTGNDGKNSLDGGSGKDSLDGGLGSDTLKGGSSDDTFVFKTRLGSSNVDTISDFSHAHDRIQLENAIFTKLTTTGTLAGTAFYAHAGATHGHDTSDRIVYDTSTGKLYYDDDGSGSHAAVQFAVLTGHPSSLSASDFQIV